MAGLTDDLADGASSRAAGGLVWRVSDGVVEVVIVHRPVTTTTGRSRRGSASPKTRATRRARLREVEEETGYRCVLGREVASVEYRDRKQRHKVVRYWEMTVVSGRFASERGGRSARWLPIPMVAKRLTYPRDRDVLACVRCLCRESTGAGPVRTSNRFLGRLFTLPVASGSPTRLTGDVRIAT